MDTIGVGSFCIIMIKILFSRTHAYVQNTDYKRTVSYKALFIKYFVDYVYNVIKFPNSLKYKRPEISD